jgi:hypothetical protein
LTKLHAPPNIFAIVSGEKLEQTQVV